jgi:hypothetical protein
MRIPVRSGPQQHPAPRWKGKSLESAPTLQKLSPSSSALAAHFANYGGPGTRNDEFVDAQVRRMKSGVEWIEVNLTTEQIPVIDAAWPGQNGCDVVEA